MTTSSKNTTSGEDDSTGAKKTTAVRRAKSTRRAVIIADKVADKTITVGGVLVILAVLTIVVYLIAEVVPLFGGGEVKDRASYQVSDIDRSGALEIVMDEYKTIGAMLSKDGVITAFHAKTGHLLKSPQFDFGGKKVTAFASAQDHENVVFGFDDGSIRFGKFFIVSEVAPADSEPQSLQKLNDRDSANESSVYSSIPGGQLRVSSIAIELRDPVPVFKDNTPVRSLAYMLGGEAERPTNAVVAFNDQGAAQLLISTSRLNLLTNTLQTEDNEYPLPSLPRGVKPASVLLTANFDMVFVGEKNGSVYRYDTLNLDNPRLVENSNVTPEGVELTAMNNLLGSSSLIVGGSDGSVNIFFVLDHPETNTKDGKALVLARKFDSQKAAIDFIKTSQRGKSFATGDASGEILLRHGTSQKTLLRLHVSDGKDKEAQYMASMLAPRGDGLIVMQNNGEVDFWNFSVPHPETSWKTLFGKVWYEGYPEPTYTWQSSAATDAYEPKYSLIPLIFGTLKATFYSLLFAIPIALLGAIYTSEFVHYRIRGVLKPAMEMMASLPSVVLGFVAALVLAPIVESWISAVLLAFFVTPLCLIIAAYLWQLMPLRLLIRYQGYSKFLLMMSVVALGFYLAYLFGPAFENFFFNGDFKAWVNGDVGDGSPFLFFMLLPAVFAVVAIVLSRLFGRAFRNYVRTLSWSRAAFMDLLRWLVIAIITIISAYGLARLMNSFGMDARGEFVGTYVQRNTLVVGFAMGFAVIPIIYTIAEDALNSVPEHLRAASLGCGATPWQTAIWIILPTAFSGVFSAIMIGMGRAVGETMIVVMAAGNTPLLDWNIFNGLRALSANIAVELPEAVKGGTLYRILFLNGVVLFVITFLINTVAEVIRQRFRKRALQL